MKPDTVTRRDGADQVLPASDLHLVELESPDHPYHLLAQSRGEVEGLSVQVRDHGVHGPGVKRVEDNDSVPLLCCQEGLQPAGTAGKDYTVGRELGVLHLKRHIAKLHVETHVVQRGPLV